MPSEHYTDYPQDTTDPNAPPSGKSPLHGDWSGNEGEFYNTLGGLYRNYLGREGTPQEFDQYWRGVGPDAAYQAIYGSPEAQAFRGRQAPTPNEDTKTLPPTPPPPSGGGPPPAAAPQTAQAAPQGAAPTFQAPGFTKPPAFSYADFVAPNPGDLDKDPSYLYTLRSEQDAIQKSAAARGVLNTGGTINDLLLNAKDIASTGYSNLWNRKMGEYATNRGNAAENYRTNYDTQFRDPYQYQYQSAQDQYNSQAHAYDLSQQYGWYGKLFDFDKEKFGWQQNQDLFNDKYKLLSL